MIIIKIFAALIFICLIALLMDIIEWVAIEIQYSNKMIDSTQYMHLLDEWFDCTTLGKLIYFIFS